MMNQTAKSWSLTKWWLILGNFWIFSDKNDLLERKLKYKNEYYNIAPFLYEKCCFTCFQKPYTVCIALPAGNVG